MTEDKDVVVNFTPERIEEVVTVDEFVGIYSGNFATIVAVTAKMVVDENGNYLSEADGLKEIGRVKMRELKKFARDLKKAIRDTLVSPTSGGI